MHAPWPLVDWTRDVRSAPFCTDTHRRPVSKRIREYMRELTYETATDQPRLFERQGLEQRSQHIPVAVVVPMTGRLELLLKLVVLPAGKILLHKRKCLVA